MSLPGSTEHSTRVASEVCGCWPNLTAGDVQAIGAWRWRAYPDYGPQRPAGASVRAPSRRGFHIRLFSIIGLFGEGRL